jgi:hypothetical protein
VIRAVVGREANVGGLSWVRDVRVPTAFVGEFDPRPVGEFAPGGACTDGRHTFDVIEAVEQERWVEDPTDSNSPEVPRQRFRMALTCIVCGRVEHRAGEYWDTDTRRITRVDPVPLRFRGLVAQMIDPGSRWSRGDRDCSAWAVHDATGAPVGVICPQVGRRGAVRHAGRLFAWPVDRAWVLGASPRAVLRALARALAQDAAVTPSVDAEALAAGDSAGDVQAPTRDLAPTSAVASLPPATHAVAAQLAARKGDL